MERQAGLFNIAGFLSGSEWALFYTQGLETASDDELEAVEILGAGYGLHWEALDVDLSVPGLMAGLFGTKAYMARRAGQATSAAKAAAARENGRKGGRPRKQA